MTPKPPPTVHMIEVAGASKTFGNVVAVSDVSFTLDEGVTALLGPNGAGKSTLFRMLCGLTTPTVGNVKVLGRDARKDTPVRGKIGLSPQQDALFDRLTAHQFVEIAAKTHGVANTGKATTHALTLVDLETVTDKALGSFSKGMRQRVKLAAALVNDPEILILDEPLSGLDPVQRNRMIELFHDLGSQGKCVLISSHILDEVARIGSQVLVIAQGRLAASGDYRDLRTLMEDQPHVIQITTNHPRKLGAALLEREVIDGITIEKENLNITTSHIGAFGRSIAPIAKELNVSLNEVIPMDDDLESVFRYLIEGK
tara:strand:- start:671 stop:1609 length:939 start_codon:yes stop_codon:yes gene_type:complete